MDTRDKEILFSGLVLIGLILKYGAVDYDYLSNTSVELGKAMARRFPDITEDLHE